jgi:hypothetical protein
MSSTQETLRKNHVLIFRHCVRSTAAEVNIYNVTNSSPQPLSDFWSRLVQPEVPLPEWNVPTDWCTEKGMKQMHDTGTFIYNTLVRRPHSNGKNLLSFRFLSDTSQRDADTTLSLQEGIAHAILTDNTVDGNTRGNFSLLSSKIHVTEYVPNVFHPFDTTTMSSTPVCSFQATPLQWQQEVETRLTNIPLPTLSFLDTLKLLQLVNVNDPESMNSNETTTVALDSSNIPRLTGMINAIKLTVQTLFYSRASGITPMQFLNRITNPQIYLLLPWVQYSRSILSIGTSESASRGAVLVRTILDALQFDTNADTDPFDQDSVTVLVGHDTDLDAIATAMDVAWEVGSPYNNDNNSSLYWYATPPGSAIYITHEQYQQSNSNDTVVTMSYLYPVYNLDANDGSILSWEIVPLQLMNVSNVTSSANATTLTWNQLQQHVKTTLLRYTGATDCYNSVALNPDIDSDRGSSEGSPNASDGIGGSSGAVGPNTNEDLGKVDQPETTSTYSASSWGSGFGTGIAVSFVLASLLWYCIYRRQRRLRSHYTKASSIQLNEYDTVGGVIQPVDFS